MATGPVPGEKLVINRILEVKINSSINPATLDYLTTAYQNGVKNHWDLVLIRLNTPGGLVSVTKEILTLIGSSPLPTVVWVGPEGASATSAGAIIASGAHILTMAAGTNIGAATPIEMGADVKQTDLRAKAINDLVALTQSLTEARGRNAQLFGEMISAAKSFKAQEALEDKIIDGIVNSDQELFALLHGKSLEIMGKKVELALPSPPQVVLAPMDLGQKLLDIFANPSMAYILFMIGVALIYLELQAPGGFIAGSIGAICLILAGIGMQVLPLNFGAFALILLSILLFVLETYILSFGMLTLAALAALITGSLFLFRTEDAYMDLSLQLILAVAGAIGLFVGFIAFYWAVDARQKKPAPFFSLQGKYGIISGEVPSTIPNSYCYQIKVEGEIWKARSPVALPNGSVVKILGKDPDGLTLLV